MALGLTNITASQIATELGITIGVDRDVSDLTRYSSTNKWSFRRCGAIGANASTKLIEYTPFTEDDKGGDFREFNQTSTAPVTEDDFAHKWGPSGSTTTIQITITPNQLNLKELNGNYYTFKFYSTSSNRTNKTSPIKTDIVAVSFTTVSAPSGHTNNQTQKPTSPQIVNVTGVSTAYSVLYLDSYVSDISGNEIARFDDSYTDITLSEYQQPIMKATGSIPSGDLPSGNSPAGYAWSATGSRFQIYTAATPKDSASTVEQTYASTSYSFYWTVVLSDSAPTPNFYTAGISSITIRTYLDDGSQSYDQEIENATSNSDPTTQRAESGTISGASFSYDQEWEVYYDTTAGISYNGTYSLI